MNLKKIVVPQTRPGIFSILGIPGFIIFFILGRSIVIRRGPFESPSFFNDPIPAALTIIGGLCGVFAFFAGMVALIKSRERAIPVFISTLIGLFITAFWLGEILSPH